MILFNLRCAEGHNFEAWFKDGAAYDQRVVGAICCPSCGTAEVNKAPMAPRIARSRGDVEPPPSREVELARKVRELRRKVEESCDYVGERFAEEARRIHYGECKPHDIYGEASGSEAEALHEEGVVFQCLPSVPRANS